jgi:hypothetical protein
VAKFVNFGLNKWEEIKDLAGEVRRAKEANTAYHIQHRQKICAKQF